MIRITLIYVFSHIYISDSMPNMTLSIPKNVYDEMKKYPEIRWSEVARQSIIKKISDLRRMNELLKTSTLTENDIEELDKKVKQRIWAKHRAE